MRWCGVSKVFLMAEPAEAVTSGCTTCESPSAHSLFSLSDESCDSGEKHVMGTSHCPLFSLYHIIEAQNGRRTKSMKTFVNVSMCDGNT